MFDAWTTLYEFIIFFEKTTHMKCTTANNEEAGCLACKFDCRTRLIEVLRQISLTGSVSHSSKSISIEPRDARPIRDILIDAN